jgi:hypothetical protein
MTKAIALQPIARVRTAILVAAFVMAVCAAQHAAAAQLSLSSAHLTATSKTYGAPVTCTLGAAADSYANKLLAGSNFGTGTTLLVSPDLTTTERAFLRFDLTTCSPAISAGAIVQSASLKLTVALLTTAARTIELRSVLASWTEAGLTWTNQPSAAGSATSSATVPAATIAGAVVTWTATSDVQAFVSGAATNVGWRLGDSVEGVVAGPILTLNSKEAASGRPQLVVTYIS